MSDHTTEKQLAVVKSISEPVIDTEKNVVVGGVLKESEVHLDDETGELAVQALTSDEADPAVAKRVLRKIDLYILPFMCITYGLQFLDKTGMSYSSVFGLRTDNHLVGQQYSWASSIFYFGYLIAEYPGVNLLQRFPVAKFLGINIIAWASILMITASCSSFAGLATVRFFLGIFEATISPGFVLITSTWWTRQEQASRSALWVSCLGIFGTIGGLLTFGLCHITGSLHPWKYIFLVLGAVTIAWGVAFILVVPDSPATASWLTEEEKVVAVQRVIENKTGTKSPTFVKAQMIEALTDPKIILLTLISFVNALPSGGLSFGSIIITGLGYTNIDATLMNIPLSAIQAFFTLSTGFLQSRIPNSRLHLASLAMIPPIIGTLLINQLDNTHKWGRLVGVWLLAGYPVGFMVLLSLMAVNIAGSTKKTTANAMVFVFYCVGQIVGPQCFKASQYPGYHDGITAMLVSFILNLVFNQVLRFLYMRENKMRDEKLVGKSEEEIETLKGESRIQGFENVTDNKNVFFRYVV